MVGGTAKLPGIVEFAKDKLELPARLGKVRGLEGLVDTVDDPSFATATGLMLLDIILAPFATEQIPSNELFGGNIQSLSKLMKKFRQ